MPDYSKGNICNTSNSIDDDIYVGSTIKTLSQRMAQHRLAVKRGNIVNYINMRELGAEHCYIELFEHYSCNDVYELRAR